MTPSSPPLRRTETASRPEHRGLRHGFAATSATVDADGESLTVRSYDTATAVYGPQQTATSSLLALLLVVVLHLGLVGIVLGGNISR